MNLIIEPLITEKSVNFAAKGKYIFKVLKKATKNEIKKDVSRQFSVKVDNVNILYQKEKIKKRGKTVGKKSSFKKAIVTLKKGEKIKELEVKE